MSETFNPDWKCKPDCVASEVLKERLRYGVTDCACKETSDPVAWQVFNELTKTWTQTYHNEAKADTLVEQGYKIRPLYARTPAIADGVGDDALNMALTALLEFVYQTTHLSPREPDGSHCCRISGDCLSDGRKAITALMQRLGSTPPQAATDEG